MNWKIIVLVLVVVALGVGYFIYTREKSSNLEQAINQPSVSVSPSSSPSVSVKPSATAVEDALSAIDSFAVSEAAQVDLEKSDADLLGADAQAISDFNQTYETQF